jgi:SAM-dependent methyltransferase
LNRSIELRPMKSFLYDKSCYTSEPPEVVLQSPRGVVPFVMSMVSPKSVVDVGCGSGAWLCAFREHGVRQIVGIEGAYVDPSWLLIPKEYVRTMDLSKSFRMQETFDLAVCLEVAEHLPKRCAPEFVESLVSLAPIVLFSAAVPEQGGVHHVNEQWPGYWAELFLRHGFRQLDTLRGQIWKNPEIKFFYRQNIFFYVRQALIPTYPEFLQATERANDLMLVETSILEAQMGLRPILKNLPSAFRKFLARRFRAIRASAKG